MLSQSKQPIVLMYHGVSSKGAEAPEAREEGAEIYDVPLTSFREQMRFLKEHNYNVGGDILITFDDGEMNNFTEAAPVLEECEFKAYFFVISQRIGKPGYMGFPELKALHEAGMTVGSHGFSHEILTELLDTQMEEELRASKKYLETNLETTIDTLSIPRGFCDDKVIQTAYDFGYKTVFISERPRRIQAKCLSRIAVKTNWSIGRFRCAVEGCVPRQEQALDIVKRATKRMMGGRFYSWLRRQALR